MQKRTLTILLLVLLFMLIGTANADWFAQKIATPITVSEHIVLISVGAFMVMLAFFGRTRIKRHTS